MFAFATLMTALLFTHSVLATVALAGLGALVFLLGLHVFREGSQAASTPEAEIKSVGAGLARVRGKATGNELLTSPITGLRCFYYDLQVEKWQKEDEQSEADIWQEFKQDTEQRSFYLDDGTGHVLVDLEKAEFDLPRTLYAEIGPKSSHSWRVDPSLEVPRLSEQQLYALLASDWQKARIAVQSSVIPGAKAAGKLLAIGEKMASKHLAMDIGGVTINPGEIGESFRFTETCLLADSEYTVIGTCERNGNAQGVSETTIGKGPDGKTFLITAKKGEQVGFRLQRNGIVMMLVGGTIVFGALLMRFLGGPR